MRCFYNYIQILSLDVVAGVCICALFIGDFLNVRVSNNAILCLGIAVWLIYTFDHLLDARNGRNIQTPRHFFHQRHFKILVIVFIGLAGLGGMLLFQLSPKVLYFGVLQLIGIGCYFAILFLFRRKNGLTKELLIGLLYSTGILIPSLGAGADVWDLKLIWLGGVFFLLAFINVLVFALYEEEEDREAEHQSLVLVLGRNRVDRITKVGWFIGIVGISYGFGFAVEATLILLLMHGILGALLFYPRVLNRNSEYRILGDGIFLLPILALV